MSKETEICMRYEAELAAIAELDRAYYLKTAATPSDRADYFNRQERLEGLRTRLYAELSVGHYQEPLKPPLFRLSVIDHSNGKLTVSAPQCRLAHDLNNALGVILGRCELLEASVSKESELGKHLASIRESARRIAGSIKGSICTEGPLQNA